MWIKIVFYVLLIGLFLLFTIPKLKKVTKKGNIYLKIIGVVMSFGGLFWFVHLSSETDLSLLLILSVGLITCGMWLGNKEKMKDYVMNVETTDAKAKEAD